MEDSPSLDLEEVHQQDLIPDELYFEVNDPIEIIEENTLTTPTPTEQPIIKKIVSRNVGNTTRRRFR
jgi:hypothetical protein